MSVTLREAAEKRAEAAARDGGGGDVQQRSAPGGVVVRRGAPHRAEMRAETVEKGGKEYVRLTGMASVYESRYEMWDWYGPYEEEVAEGAGANSLAKSPDVVFLLNHTGIPFARTISGTLDLSEPGGGLLSEAYLNPKRQDVQDLVRAVEDGAITEMSFAFRIMDGRWSPDYQNYRINEYDIDRGDTSGVTFGANPATSIEAREAAFALRNDLARSDRDSLLAGLTPAEAPPQSRLTGQALADLRNLRAAVGQGSTLDLQERAALGALLDALADDPARLDGDSPLAALLGVRAADPAPVERFKATDIGFLLQEIESARTF